MRTVIFEGVVTAKTQISHNGGEVNGNVSAFRRMKVIQEDGKYIEVPHVSGNSVRGKLRDIAAMTILDNSGDENGHAKVALPLFQLMFSGGSLTSGTGEGDIGKFKEMRKMLPNISLFGGAWGNAIMPGKIKVNPLIPISKETAHILPEQYASGDLPSVFSCLELSMYTRKENSKDPNLEHYIDRKETDSSGTSQMIYYVENISAGTKFYWKIVCEDLTENEFDFLLLVLNEFQNNPTIGGKGAVGFGQIDISDVAWSEIGKEQNENTFINQSDAAKIKKALSDGASERIGFLNAVK